MRESVGDSRPHQLRHAHAVELAREGVAVNIIQRQLGHTDLGTTSTYLQGIDPSEIIEAVRSRRPPTIQPAPDSRSKTPADTANKRAAPPTRSAAAAHAGGGASPSANRSSEAEVASSWPRRLRSGTH